ncbi:hypothetical protein DVT68_06900 [Dyella solisilvae]|uniref:Uncharacterized protein n=1 Tax=Dyella solisilvae TaxID=1920168 RepID=A0A370KDI0_9GAMM|nr:hypothetical protein [Dyella solisilvae]RDJ00714.1 hypothetical protein DVT68_06900 [Dyella solisilvae]
MQRNLDGNMGSHEGAGNSSSGGDALGVSRESNTQPGSSSSSSNDNCPSAAPAPSARNRRANLGWQSLLPGSIQ